MRKKTALCGICLWLCFFLTGCRFVKIEEEPRTPMTYTVVKENNLPEHIQNLIEEKKEQEFRMTYRQGEDYYLIRGYGIQLTGGYSVQVEELGESSNTIFYKTKLLSPEKYVEGSTPSCPYLAVKIPYEEKMVVFLS